MSTQDFIDSVFELQSVRKAVKELAIYSLRNSLKGLNLEEREEPDWNHLIEVASVLAQSNKAEHLDAALRVAQTCLQSKSDENLRIAAGVLLDVLTNAPSARLAEEMGFLPKDLNAHIPRLIRTQRLFRKYSHSLKIGSGETVELNRFQRDAYSAFLQARQISLSAPTSAGKSFILLRMLENEVLRHPHAHVVCIEPTRALVAQVERDVLGLFHTAGINGAFISTVPEPPENDTASPVVLIFTQERFSIFRSKAPSFNFELMIVDEAQKISDGSRGILLEEAISRFSHDFPMARIVLASPQTKNPELLLEMLAPAPSEERAAIKRDFVSVNQNVLWLSQEPRHPMLWNASLLHRGELVKAGFTELEKRPTTDKKKIVYVIRALIKQDEGTIIYCNGPADTENIGALLKDELSEIRGEKLDALSELAAETVHGQYLLTSFARHGIGFHYGNMPLILRTEIENAFREGYLKYLVCTSTLLEGVNLPAKTLVMLKPRRGKSGPLTGADFWNLAGRAGRLGMEFQGNVICISPNEWDAEPPKSRGEDLIVSAYEEVISEFNGFLTFLRQNTPRLIANQHPSWESAASFLIMHYISGSASSIRRFTQAQLKTLEPELERIKNDVEVPIDILKRNPNISPIAQTKLLRYFRGVDDPSILIPQFPEQRDAVSQSYEPLVRTISTYLSGDPTELSFPHAILVVNWMKGLPLPQIIDRSFSYWQARGKTIHTVIRETMKDIEEYVRFKFAKYSSCYIDLLRYHLAGINKDELAQRIPDLAMWLEFGVYSTTQVSLMSLGMSRHSAIRLSEIIANEQMSRTEALAWLKSRNIGQLPLSRGVAEEISKLVILLA